MTYQCIIRRLFGNRRIPCSFSPRPARVNPHSQGRELPLFVDELETKNCIMSQECSLAWKAVRENRWTPLPRTWLFLSSHFPLVLCDVPWVRVCGAPALQGAWQGHSLPGHEVSIESRCLLDQGPSPYPAARGIRCHWKQGTWSCWAKTAPGTGVKGGVLHRCPEPWSEIQTERVPLEYNSTNTHISQLSVTKTCKCTAKFGA